VLFIQSRLYILHIHHFVHVEWREPLLLALGGRSRAHSRKATKSGSPAHFHGFMPCQNCVPRPSQCHDLCLHAPPRHALLLVTFPLFFQEFSLLFGAHTFESLFPLVFLGLVARVLAAFCLFQFVKLSDLFGFLISSCLDTTQNFGAEVCAVDEMVRKSEKCSKKRLRLGSVNKANVELQSLLWYQIIESTSSLATVQTII